MPPATRRRLLQTLAGATTAGLAGCTGIADVQRGSGETSAEITPPVRGRGESVTAERTYTDAAGYDDNMAYFPSNETVRVVTVVSDGEPAGYATWPFAKWGRIHTGETALERARIVTADRLGTDAFGSGVGTPPDGILSLQSFVVTLWVSVTPNPETPMPEPPVTVTELARATPRHVATTVTLDGDSYERRVPVFVNQVEAAVAD